MNYGTMTKTGIIGSVVAAICCATPVLVLLLGVAPLGVGGLARLRAASCSRPVRRHHRIWIAAATRGNLLHN
jgi:hypothetical protein